MLELLQEEELEAIERERAVHEIARNAELAEAQRLEQEKRRVFDEKQRRIEQTNRHAREQAELEERLAARKGERLLFFLLLRTPIPNPTYLLELSYSSHHSSQWPTKH